ncbi:hypothetical protein FFF34_002095 [Inquilinus sp. KBS0705]|nr:hypothetical protein FFF34_002095 [Inquilinus sp. KBS0705]
MRIFTGMKSKEEILYSYYTEAKDGLPEISADDLLKALDEYASQSFNAAREINNTEPVFATYTDYLAKLEANKPGQSDKIRLIADNVVSQFLPTDPAIKEFSFDFKTDGVNYTACYTKNQQGYWEYISFK